MYVFYCYYRDEKPKKFDSIFTLDPVIEIWTKEFNIELRLNKFYAFCVFKIDCLLTQLENVGHLFKFG